MSDETNIEILASEEILSEDATIMEPKPRKRFGLPALLGAMFLSSAFGAGIIGAVSHFNKTAIPDFSPLTAKIETVSAEAQTLASENKKLKSQVAGLQRDIKKVSRPVAVDLTPLEKRLKTLEGAKPNEIDPEVLTRLEALRDEGSEALDLSDILARLDALERRPISTQILSSSVPKSAVTDMLEFPSEVILASLEKPEGWLKKLLKKHISVQSDENPRYLVEQIHKYIDAGNVDAAIAAFEKLPAEAKAAGQAWRESLDR